MKKIWLMLVVVLIISFIIFLLIYLFPTDKFKDTKWVLNTWSANYDNKYLNKITINFDNNKIYGSSGVNTYGTNYKISGLDKIYIEEIQATEMASDDQVLMQTEGIYLGLLKRVNKYVFVNKQLVFYDANNNELLRFNQI